MTNWIFTLIINTITNWTGVQMNGLEPGIVATQHVARIVWQEGSWRTNDFPLTTNMSGIAVWRMPEPKPSLFVTNDGFKIWMFTNWNRQMIDVKAP